MAQTLWIGNIHFKDTNVPVKLKLAVNQDRIQFHLLHKTDKTKLHQQMICAFEKTPVSSDQVLKGYRVAERKYVLIGPEDLKHTEPSGQSRNIAVHEFVKAGKIAPVFMKRTYYLEPESPANEYNTLAAALKEMACLGLCTWAMKKRSYLGALGSDGRLLRLTILRYADEIVPSKSLGLGSYFVSEKELDIAGELIDKLTAHFQPERFKNEHEQKLHALINKKSHGTKIVIARPKPVKSTAPSELLKALEDSLKVAA